MKSPAAFARRGLSLLLFVTTQIVHGRHLLGSLNPNPELVSQMAKYELSTISISLVLVPTAIALALSYFRSTFAIANSILAATMTSMAVLFLRTGHSTEALVEIVFVLMPLLMIYLGYPFTRSKPGPAPSH